MSVLSLIRRHPCLPSHHLPPHPLHPLLHPHCSHLWLAVAVAHHPNHLHWPLPHPQAHLLRMPLPRRRSPPAQAAAPQHHPCRRHLAHTPLRSALPLPCPQQHCNHRHQLPAWQPSGPHQAPSPPQRRPLPLRMQPLHHHHHHSSSREAALAQPPQRHRRPPASLPYCHPRSRLSPRSNSSQRPLTQQPPVQAREGMATTFLHLPPQLMLLQLHSWASSSSCRTWP